jgi:sugar O-acyltransferase (sialic acid O-acetyltransferase NeuD family)
MKSKKLILFGKGPFAEIAKDYFTDDSQYEVVAFTLDASYINEETYLGLPMIPFESIELQYQPDTYEMHIALSYTDLNKLREKKFIEAKRKGYTLASYVSSHSSYLSKIPCGENCFIFEDNTIQPYVKIEENVILWSGNHIGHHSHIHAHNFISSHVVISGQCTIESHSFIGVNASIGHHVTIGSENIIGAGCCITKSTEQGSVYVPAKSIKLEKQSSEIKL